MYDFTSDWTSDRAPAWEAGLTQFMGTPIEMVEIGTYEGRSAVWFLEHVLTHPQAKLHCVDCYSYGERKELGPNILQQAKQRAAHNLADFVATGNCELHYLAASEWWQGSTKKVGLIYVDGQHTFNAALTDFFCAWVRLQSGGVLICDDVWPAWYLTGRFAEHDTPLRALETFLNWLGTYAIRYQVLWHNTTAGILKP